MYCNAVSLVQMEPELGSDLWKQRNSLCPLPLSMGRLYCHPLLRGNIVKPLNNVQMGRIFKILNGVSGPNGSQIMMCPTLSCECIPHVVVISLS
jgi:hypothetical protein